MSPVIAAPENTREAWSARAAVHPEPWAASGWSEDGQRLRHKVVLAALDPKPGEKLLDWGCGTGELCRLLEPGISYTGYDWAAGMVERARNEHPWGPKFVDHHPAGHFDIVACIGPFNLPGGWSKERTWHTIRNLWDTTECRAIAVSLYAGADPNCLSYTVAETLRFGSLGYGSVIEHIRANDILLVARR